MVITKRHQVEAAIRRRQLEQPSRLVGAGTNIGMADRHQFGTRGRARCAQHECKLVCGGGAGQGCHSSMTAVKREAPRGTVRLHHALEQRDTQAFREVRDRARRGSRHDQRLGFHARQAHFEFA